MHWQPPPNEPNADGEAFKRDLMRFLEAFARWHLVGTSEAEARRFLNHETERLTAFDRARREGLIVRG
jgi:hypothetical protein